MTIVIEISNAEFVSGDVDLETVDLWFCWLKLTNTPSMYSFEEYMLPSNAPGTLLESELQAYFDNIANELWTLAQLYQYPIDTGNSGAFEAQGGAKQWYKNNPAAEQLFTLSPTDLESEIDDLVNDLFPLASNPNKKRIRFLLTSLSYNDRIIMRRLGLV